MRSKPAVLRVPVVSITARHVKRMSSDVIGVPSLQTASSRSRNVTVNGSSVIMPFSRLGASVSTGEAR